MTLTQAQKDTAAHALRVAAEQYLKDAETCRESPVLAQQFHKQRKEALELADRIEQS